MANSNFGPRKRRTRDHVIADLSVNFVERLVLEAGHTVLRVPSDYGYDLSVVTHDQDGYVEPDHFRLQLKASEALKPVRQAFL